MYELYIPPEKLDLTHYGRVREWEELAVELICAYATQYWRKQKNIWEHKHIEIVKLCDAHPNYIAKYELLVDQKEEKLIKEIKKMATETKKNSCDFEYSSSDDKVVLLSPKFHAYRPLLHAPSRQSVQITPVPLNNGETKFIRRLRIAVENLKAEFLKTKHIHLMRNMSRGSGISFFDDYAFYPDFILWIKDPVRQDILFIDPKGLVHYNPKLKSKKDLHKRIKKIEKKIQKDEPNVLLHSYIWSDTPAKYIGGDIKKTNAEYQDQGIFLVQGQCKEITELLQHASNRSLR